MKITALVENTTSDPALSAELGLSLYIELNDQKILFDCGQGTLFLKNAKQCGIDLKAVDLVVISHGHFDHGGGLSAFLEVNDKAKIYISRHAFGDFYLQKTNGELQYIGLDQALQSNERFILIDQDTQINEHLKLYTNIQPTRLNSMANHHLYSIHDHHKINDDFSHEIDLVVTEGSQKILCAGCAHSGIINIIDQISLKEGKVFNTVIGGFHLDRHMPLTSEDKALIHEITSIMMKSSTQVYTCHCTGLNPYALMKEIMGNQIDYLSVGQTIEIVDK